MPPNNWRESSTPACRLDASCERPFIGLVFGSYRFAIPGILFLPYRAQQTLGRRPRLCLHNEQLVQAGNAEP